MNQFNNRGYRAVSRFATIIIIFTTLLLILLPIFAAISVVSPGLYSGTVIRDSERVCDSGGQQCRYLVFLDNETLANQDALLNWKWNSSDLHPLFTKGMVCTGTANWYRVQFLSMYRNIITADCKAPS